MVVKPERHYLLIKNVPYFLIKHKVRTKLFIELVQKVKKSNEPL